MGNVYRGKFNTAMGKPVGFKSEGFLPNFASPLDRAFKTERKMGGDPALDFDPSIGYFVRDKKRQSNFAAVKRDHPEGLRAAIGNSRLMQQAASGIVPNFAQPSLLTPQQLAARRVARGGPALTPGQQAAKEKKAEKRAARIQG